MGTKGLTGGQFSAIQRWCEEKTAWAAIPEKSAIAFPTQYLHYTRLTTPGRGGYL
jgi:hypothetical protein